MEILKQFGIQPILLAAQAVNFLILLFILKKFLYKPVLKVLEDRKKKIEDSLKNAEAIEKRLQEVEVQVDKMIAKAAEEGQKILDESKKSAAQIIEAAKMRAEGLAQDIARRNEESMKLRQEKILTDAKVQITDLVLAVFKKVTGKTLTSKSQKEMIDKTVRGMS